MVTFDAATAGTSAADWDTLRSSAVFPELDLASLNRVCVVSAHPDDETLGAGGLLAECARRGISLSVVVVTDGSASHPSSTTVDPAQLAELRRRELFTAIAELAPECEVTLLGFPDGETERYRNEIRAALELTIPPGTTVLSPWRGDGHRDHRVVAEICAAVVAGSGGVLLEYPIWMWHWANPRDARVPWANALDLPLDEAARTAKRQAVSRHVSQVAGLGPAEGDGPVLSADFLANFDQQREVFLMSDLDQDQSRSQQYFDDLYSRNSDPWRLATRWYEERKRAVTVASLPRQRYGQAIEIGCSVGELTAALASRCDHLLGIDISAAAIQTAAARTADLEGVRVEVADATAGSPDGVFDLVVLSEVAYYWSAADLRRVLQDVKSHLAPGADVLACHWRHPVEDYPLSGDEAHEIIRTTLDLKSLVLHSEEDFLLEVFSLDEHSVARREGLLS